MVISLIISLINSSSYPKIIRLLINPLMGTRSVFQESRPAFIQPKDNRLTVQKTATAEIGHKS